MTNNSSNNTWTVNFILNANGLGGGDAVITLNEVLDSYVYEVEVLGDLVADTDTIEEAFALAEDMISFYDAVNAVVVEVEEEIEELENEIAALDKVGHYLGETFSNILFNFLSDEIGEQLNLLEGLDNYDYDMFVEDREESLLNTPEFADFDALIDEIVDSIWADEEAFEYGYKAEEERIHALDIEEDVNGNLRGPFSTIR